MKRSRDSRTDLPVPLEAEVDPIATFEDRFSESCLGEDVGNPVMGRLLNVSGRGIGIWVPIAFQAGEPLCLQVGQTMILGDVRYCRSVEDTDTELEECAGYRLGLEVMHYIGRSPLELLAQSESTYLSFVRID